MKAEQVRPLGKRVLIEAAIETETDGGIIVPPSGEARYPQIGWVVAVGSRTVEGLTEGDLVIIPNEGCDVGHVYSPACSLVLKDWPTVEICDLDIWPVLKEVVEKSRRTGEDKILRIKTIDSSWLKMQASDVLDYSIVDISDPTLKLEYVNAEIAWLEKDGRSRMFYFVSESDILATLEFNDGSRI